LYNIGIKGQLILKVWSAALSVKLVAFSEIQFFMAITVKFC